MPNRLMPWFLIALATLVVAGQAAAESRRVRSGDVVLESVQTAPLKLRLDYRLSGGAEVSDIAAKIRGTELAAPARTPYPADGQVTAIYFLIDTSDPARARVVAEKIKHIKAILANAKPHHRFGLATFDQDLRVLVPLGARADAIEAALAKVKAVGLRTYFFEAGIEAARALGTFEADRRFLFIFSDGKVEDVKTAYDVRSLVAAAQKANVRVYGFGYSRAAVEPREFQNLRVPAKETGGLFLKTDARYRLPEDFLKAPFAGMDRGGRAIFDLTAARAAKLSGAQTAEIVVTLKGGRQIALKTPVTLPELALGGKAGRLFDQARERRNLPYTIGAAVAVLLSLVLLIWLIARARRRRRARLIAEAPKPAIAVLKFYDANGTSYDMTGETLSLGRGEDNDVTLANDSVSGYHATINRKRDGSFIITDRDSANGIAINDEEVKIAELKDGDEVDLGEVRFRFTVAPDMETGTA